MNHRIGSGLRHLVCQLFYLSLVCVALFAFPRNSEAMPDKARMDAAFRQLEVRAQGRLGVHLLDTASGGTYGYRSDERFMMLSSFKMLACAHVLYRVDRHQESLQRRIRYGRSDLVPWSPITEKHVGSEGLTLARLCEATMTVSDNTAANLILDSFGGPQALTAFVRGMGDELTRLDRYEPALNVPGADPQLDTSTPRAMAENLGRLLLGDRLSPESRQLLRQWMLANTTGEKRLKAGLPTSWKIGDKTGSNATDSNDIGVVYAPGRAPILIAAYLSGSALDSAGRDAILAEVACLIAGFLQDEPAR